MSCCGVGLFVDGLTLTNHHRRPHNHPPPYSTYTNGHNFDSQWRVFCRAQTPRATEYLTQITEALPAAQQGSNPTTLSVKWPRLAPGIQVQIVSAGLTVHSPPATPGGRNVYHTQAQAYNDTLAAAPAASEWVVCEGCAHGFPYERTEYLAEQLLRLYQRA